MLIEKKQVQFCVKRKKTEHFTVQNLSIICSEKKYVFTRKFLILFKESHVQYFQNLDC